MAKHDYPRDLAGEIFDRVQEVYGAPHEAGFLAAHPRVDQLEAILDEVFLASMTMDEGRPTRCNVAFVKPEELASASPLAKRQPLNAENLRRLSPALSQDTSCICACDDGSDDLAIWGVTNLTAPGSSQLPRSAPER